MRRLSHLKIIAVLLALTAPPIIANASSEFLITDWRTEDGLPHSSVNSLVQTKDGYLWIGTYVGVARFDGTRFVHFSTANLPQLGPGRVSKLFEDRDGTLWIGLESGRLLAFRDGEARIHLPNSVPKDQAIVSMVQTPDGTIWLQTIPGELGRLTPDSVEFVTKTGPVNHRPGLKLAVDRGGTLWVGTKDGLKIWHNDQLTTPPGMEEMPTQPIDVFGFGHDGALWTLRDRNLQCYRTGQPPLAVAIPDGFAGPSSELLETADGRLWLAAADGGLFCREPGGKWRSITAADGLRGGTKALCEDREGNLWRGGFGSGLARIRDGVFAVYELPVSEQDRYALAITPDTEGNVWALFNAHSLGRVIGSSGLVELWQTPELPQSFRVAYQDRTGSLWLGTGNGYVYRGRNGEFSREFKMPDANDFVSAFFTDSKSNIWVGYTGGAGVGVMPHGNPMQWRTVEGISTPDVRCIVEAADGAMWFGTHYGGAFRWQDGKWTRFTGRDGLPSDYVRGILAEPDGTLWLATIGGLCRWRDGRFTPITTRHGLWHDSLSHVTDDDQGNLWFSSFGGVFRVLRQELNDFADGRSSSIQCVGYGRNDGLPALESPGGFQPSGAKTPDGQIWFPTVNGIASVRPNALKENKLPPPVWIEEVAVDGTVTRIHPENISLRIGPGKRRFDFRFTALSLASPEKIRFRHKLEGLEKDWSPPDAERSVTYSYLPPGQYTFRVTACNNDGVWQPEDRALLLQIAPFFWQTWWFQASAGLLLIASVAFTVRRVERWKAQLRLERLEQQHAVEHERSRIARDIHDDLGANLTQIVYLSQRVEGAKSDAQETARWLRQIPATARRTIQSLDEIVWAINPQHDSLESLANYLSQFAAQHLSLAGVRCMLDVPTVLPALQLTAELRHNLVLAAREAMQNAVSHAAASEVRVALQLDNDRLSIIIADNGRGFNPGKISKDGNGLQNMRRRMDDIGGNAEVSSQPGQGTSVRLSLSRSRLLDHSSRKPGRLPKS